MLHIKKFFLTIIVFVAMFTIFLFFKPQEDQTNDELISLEELITYGDKNANIIINYFSNKYNISSFGKNFWLKSYQDEKPTDKLYEAALEDIKKHRSILKLAIELKIIDPITFTDEKKEWHNQNSELALWQFLNAKDDNLKDKIMTKLLKSTPANDTELRKAFEHLEDKYKKTDFMIEGIELPVYDGEFVTLETIAYSTPEDATVEEVLDYWQDQLPTIIIETFYMKSDEIQKEDLYSMSISEILSDQEVGKVVKGYQENQYFYIVKKEGGRLLSFEDAPQLAENYYINSVYNEKIKRYQDEMELDLPQKSKDQFTKNYQK